MENNGDSKFIYFLTGLSIGALIGVLFAPQAGERTREMLAEKSREGRDYLRNKSQELRDQASDYVERGKGALAEKRDHLTAAVEAGKQAYRAESQSKSGS